MSIFSEAKALNAAFNKGAGDVRVVETNKLPVSIQSPSHASLVVEEALRKSGLACDVQCQGVNCNVHLYDGRTDYPFSIANTQLEALQRNLAVGWEKQNDKTWLKKTNDSLFLSLAERLNPNDSNVVIEDFETGATVGISLPNDEAMSAFAENVGFTSPVKSK